MIQPLYNGYINYNDHFSKNSQRFPVLLKKTAVVCSGFSIPAPTDHLRHYDAMPDNPLPTF